jgi:hypothetical protein
MSSWFARRNTQSLRSLFNDLDPDVVLGVLKISREHIDRLPSPGAHDRSGIVPRAEKILSRSNAHRVTAERSNIGSVTARSASRRFD